MKTEILDLNLRVEHNRTIAMDLDHSGVDRTGERVLVLEEESGIHGEATVVAVEDGLVYLELDWGALQLPPPGYERAD